VSLFVALGISRWLDHPCGALLSLLNCSDVILFDAWMLVGASPSVPFPLFVAHRRDLQRVSVFGAFSFYGRASVENPRST
jgi:hypothetical protein